MKCEKPHSRGDPLGHFQRVFVPVDFTPASLDALRYAGILADRFGSMICLLHVIQTHPFAISDGLFLWTKSDDELAREATEQLSRLAREGLPSEQPATPLVRRGQPALEILRAAATQNADLLILTAHRRSLWRRMVLGSPVARVERHAPCPVLVFRCEYDPGTELTVWRETRPDPDCLQPEPIA
jgi:universal stress protein A